MLLASKESHQSSLAIHACLIEGLRAAGLNVYVLEADMVDALAFDVERVERELGAFLR